ncbi:MAG: glycosyltransferase family 4 protein [Leptolyngbyaceae cyanobacterium bins.59]|nr:glycosyltransferase family 4 protein [Leptolyngbyaceae cyanobacterium bins.59]
MERILFYDDGRGFGGHLVSAVDAVQYLAENTHFKVAFMFYEGNHRLHERLQWVQQQGGNLELYPMPYQESKLRTIGALLASSTVEKIQALIDAIHPDKVVIAQGAIELCSLGMLAAKRGGYPTISFIALSHKLSTMGGKLAWLRDWLNLYYYRLPDQFITTSIHAKSTLMEHGVKVPIDLVYYGPNLKSWVLRDRTESRHKYGLSQQDYVVGLVGRIQFVHKGHDFLINAIAEHIHSLRDQKIKFMIVGDGPDELALRERIEQHQLQEQIMLVPWSQESSYIYSAIDMLVIPSRFEGLPLVMLEGMYYGLPIIASAVDGMVEVLPESWLFPYGDRAALIQTLLRVKQTDNRPYLDQHRTRILEEFNVEQFGQGFYQALAEKTPILAPSLV